MLGRMPDEQHNPYAPPAEATAAEGEETYEKLADMTIELVRALVDGTGGRDRSGLFGRV